MAKNNTIWQVITASLFVVVGTSVFTHSTQAASGNGDVVATMTYQGPEVGSCEPVTANEMRLIVKDLDPAFDPLNPGEKGLGTFKAQLDVVFDTAPKKPVNTGFYNNIMNWATNTNMTPETHQFLRYTLKQLEILLDKTKRPNFDFQTVYEKYLDDTGRTAKVNINGIEHRQGWVDFYDDTLRNQDAGSLGKLSSLLQEIKQNPSKSAEKPLPADDIDAILQELEKLQSDLGGSRCGGDKGGDVKEGRGILPIIPCEDFPADQKDEISKNAASLSDDFKNIGIMITKVQEIINADRAFELKAYLGYANKGDIQSFRLSLQRKLASQMFENAMNEGATQSVEWRKGGEDEDKNTLISSMAAAIQKESDPTRKDALQGIHDKFVAQKVDTCEAPTALPAPQPISCNALSEGEKEEVLEIEDLEGEPTDQAAKISAMREPAKSIMGRLVNNPGALTPADNQFLRVRYFHQSILRMFNEDRGRQPAQVDPSQPTTINFSDSPDPDGYQQIAVRSEPILQLQIDPSDPDFTTALIGGLRTFINTSVASGEIPQAKQAEFQSKLAALDTYLKSIQLANCGGGSTPAGLPSGPASNPTVTPATPKPMVTPPAPNPTVTPATPNPTVTPATPNPTVTPATPKPTVTPPAPKPTVTPPAPKPTVTPPAPKPAVSACPMMKRGDIFTALNADVKTAPKVGSSESVYAAFDKNINTAYNRNNSKGGTSHYNLLRKAVRGIPLTAAENKAVSQTLLNTLEGSAKKAPLPEVYETLRQSLKGCK